MRIRRNAGRTGSLLGLILLLSVVSLLSYTVPGNQGFAQSDQIPSWVKGIFALYAEDQIPDSTLINAIGYLVSVGIIPITEPAGAVPDSQGFAQSDQIPSWVKGIFALYAEDQIPDSTLINAIGYLVSVGIIPITEQVGAEFEDRGDFYITYEGNPDSVYTGDDTAENRLKNAELMEYEAAFLNKNFRIPYDVEVAARECDGINAFYDDDARQIVICYELIDDLFEKYYESEGDFDEKYAGIYAYNVLDFIFFHEAGHALIDIYELSVTEPEENAVDQFAALMLSYVADEHGSYGVDQNTLYYMEVWFWIEREYQAVVSSEGGKDTQYQNRHSLDIQRFYNIACYSYGANPEYNQYLIDGELLPEDRTAGCEEEHQQIEHNWVSLLNDFDRGFLDPSSADAFDEPASDSKSEQTEGPMPASVPMRNKLPTLDQPSTFPIKYYINGSASFYEDEIHNAFVSWQENNQEFEFYEVEDVSDSTMAILAVTNSTGLGEDFEETAGLYTADPFTPTIHFVLEEYDCNGQAIRYSDAEIQDTIEHEIGHHLGLNHVIDESHLMFGDDGVSLSVYDDRGYSIPDVIEPDMSFVGQKELSDEIDARNAEIDARNAEIEANNAEIDELDAEIDALEEEYDILDEEYAKYPDVIPDEEQYQQATKLYDELIALSDQIDGLIEAYNMLWEQNNVLVEQNNVLVEQNNDEIERYNCYTAE